MFLLTVGRFQLWLEPWQWCLSLGLSLVSSAKNLHSIHVSFLPVLVLRTLVQPLLKICAWAEQVILYTYCLEELRFRPLCVLLQAAVGR